MNIKIAYSTKPAVEAVVADLKAQLGNFTPNLVVFFASSTFAPEQLSFQMQAAFAPAVVFGNTTAGEIVSGRMLKNAVVAMAFNAEALPDFEIAVVERIRTENRIPQAFTAFEKHFGTPMAKLDPQQYIGLILVDGLSGAEEKSMDKIGDLTNIFFVGGSAGDDLKFARTYVFANGQAYSDAAVLAILQPAARFAVIKTQSFCALRKTLLATKVNPARREVLEFNHKPALQAYAEAVGVPAQDAADYFMSNPVGVVAEGDIFVRSPQRLEGESMLFYCNVLEGMELSLLASTNIIEDTRQALAQKTQELGRISGILNFHCILRTLELEKKGLTEAYGRLFAEIPTIGFSTYGEEYVGHLNQTATMVAFE